MTKLTLPLFFTFVFLMLTPLIANAQSLCESGQGYLNRPAEGYGITSNMGPRNCAGCSRNHPGTDYATPCGTQIAGPPPGCVQSGSRDGISDSAAGSYGNYLQFDCGTNTAGEQISIQYAHLSNANYNASTNLITTGQSGSGGCHLDYIVTIDSQTIDAQCSTGSVESGVYSYGNSSTRHNVACPVIGQPNLCDPAVTTQLVEHGRQARGGVTTGPNISTGGGGTPPAPPDGPTTAPVTPTPGYPTSGPGGGGTTPSQPGVITGYDRDPDPARPPYQFPPSFHSL